MAFFERNFLRSVRSGLLGLFFRKLLGCNLLELTRDHGDRLSLRASRKQGPHTRFSSRIYEADFESPKGCGSVAGRPDREMTFDFSFAPIFLFMQEKKPLGGIAGIGEPRANSNTKRLLKAEKNLNFFSIF